jgi:hypothetical protein
MSLVVRQLFPRLGVNGSHPLAPPLIEKYRGIYRKHQTHVHIPHKEKKIGLPVAFNASRMIAISTSGGVASVLQLSSFK